ncbi:hypothetical protein FGU65_14440 [Methanoculleus sp. FWC-SCC1]|uniref:PGF-CTERM sorting domain-containing protein n=1 Tax=Methanoculleus frigidifontis TaxID=2584085 RepID=A0ABT8MDP6_9EURY|nr:hypothetical protein [Methanoculleus sp. FWC-SCC1]MDN7026064.1 hypothetical protein [Methanoculleus sp. FWC-SCC1]
MKFQRLLLLGLLLCCIAGVPASAVIAEISLLGPVEDVKQNEGTMVVSAAGQFGLNFTTDPPELVVDPIEPTMIEGTVPGGAAGIALFETGTSAAVTTLGAEDGTWIAVGTLKQTPQGEYVLTNLAGDPAAAPVPFAGDYTLTYTAEPACTSETGTVCPAAAVNVTLTTEGRGVWSERLEPGDAFTWNGRNDGSAVEVTFVSGEAPNPSSSGMAGPQPVSVFIVTVTPPIGVALADPGITAPTVAESPAPAGTTPAAGLLPVTAFLALLAAACVLLRR